MLFGRPAVHCRAVQQRSLMLLGYFADLAVPLWCATPYTVPFSDVAVHVVHSAVPNNHVLYALNGAVVALCRVDPNIVSTQHSTTCRYLDIKPTFKLNLL